MKAGETPLLNFLNGPKQFIIPIFQRTYSWTLKECEQLWKDIVAAATNERVAGHFIGSIVYIQKGLYQSSNIPEMLLIDGQQRLTTLSILLNVLGTAFAEGDPQPEVSQEEIQDYYLFNKHGKGDLRYKLLLTQTDRMTLINLLEDKELPKPFSRRIVENFMYFGKQVLESNLDLMTLYRGITKLIIVDISLDREHDNPQLIFESLNSTGLDLSQADLIRNYVLMGLEPKQQESLYNDYWYPMEQSFRNTDNVIKFDRFMRDYLTLKTGNIPNIRQVYEAFKLYTQGAGSNSIEEIISNIYKYSKYFVSMAGENETDSDVRKIFQDINTLKVEVAYPFLLEIYNDYVQKCLSRDEFIDILKMIEAYVFRRAICGIPTNSLNKTFATLSREIDKEKYLESFKAVLLLKDSYRRFPCDDEFMRELIVKDVYSLRSRNYLLSKLENYDRKERVDVEGYTIEHIMPQNENLPLAWKQELGDNWQEIHNGYLHTIGNLTLTGYNPELSDRPFIDKLNMEGGFADSPIRLNRDLAKLDHWNETEIQNRSRKLSKLATKIWKCPDLSSETLEIYRKSKKRGHEKMYTIDDYKHLKGDMLNLFNLFRRHVLNLDASVTEEFLKLYIAYKTITNFVDVVPQKNRLRLSLNMEFDEVNDPKNLCKDITNLGRWGNGSVEVGLESSEELDYIMALVRQSFEKHMEHGNE